MENFELDTIETVMFDSPVLPFPTESEIDEMAKWYGEDEPDVGS